MDVNDLHKITTGMIFFYPQKMGASALFKAELTEPVDCTVLQHALDRTIKRYPYFKMQIVWHDGDIYLADNPNRMIVAHTDRPRKLGSPEAGYHLIEVYGHDNFICVHLHHGIADGNGIIPFCRTLIYCYLCEACGRSFAAGSVNMPDSEIDPAELEEPFEGDFMPEIDEPAIRKPENHFFMPEISVRPRGTQHCVHISFSQSEVVRFMKEKDSSPAIILSVFMSHAVERLHPEHKGEIVTELTWNFRDGIGMPRTHNDCITVIPLTYSERIKKMPLEKQGTCFRGMTFAQTRDSDAIRAVNTMRGMVKAFEGKGYDVKSSALGYIADRPLATFCVSYVGQMMMGECEEMIRDIYMLPQSSPGLLIEVSSVNRRLSIDISMTTDLTEYIDAFCEELEEAGIHYQRGEATELVFPESNVSIIEEAKRRAEGERMCQIKQQIHKV